MSRPYGGITDPDLRGRGPCALCGQGPSAGFASISSTDSGSRFRRIRRGESSTWRSSYEQPHRQGPRHNKEDVMQHPITCKCDGRGIVPGPVGGRALKCDGVMPDRRRTGGPSVSNYKCYQASETTNVVLGEADLTTPISPPPTVVQISRAVGNPMARTLMRLCNAVLNDNLLEAQAELDSLGAMEDA